MTQLEFGRSKQLKFLSEIDFYYSLGFLASSKRTSLHWENNETAGAWGSEGRIHCHRDIITFPIPLSNIFSKGNGRIIHRINCNEYIQYLVEKHLFQLGSNQNIVNIIGTIPAIYLAHFNLGLAA